MIRAIFYIFIICAFVFNLSSVFSKDSQDEDKDYPVELYEPEADTPQTYESTSPYEGVMSTHDTGRMLEDVKRLNEMQSLREESAKIELHENIELPKLSKAFEREVLFRIREESAEGVVLPEAVGLEELAEKIVRELVKLKKEGKIPTIETETEAEEEKLKSIVSTKKESQESILQQESAYEAELEFEEESITITYLIFGKKVIIEVPMVLAENLEESQARLKRELEYMSALIDEIGRQK